MTGKTIISSFIFTDYLVRVIFTGGVFGMIPSLTVTSEHEMMMTLILNIMASKARGIDKL